MPETAILDLVAEDELAWGQLVRDMTAFEPGMEDPDEYLISCDGGSLCSGGGVSCGTDHCGED